MTPTEERLADALMTRAAQVSVETLRPLGDAPSPRWTRAKRRLAPAAAAVAAIAAIGLAAWGAQLATQSPRPFANVGTASSPPPYYVNVENAAIVIARSTTTGKITGTIPQPDFVSGGNFTDTVVASSADGRVFVVAYNDWAAQRTHLYRFSLTSSGEIAGLAAIPASLRGLSGLSVAVSPDGSQAAIAGVPDASSAVEEARVPPRLFVINLRTGSSRMWDGLRGTGDSDTIQNLAWAGRGRSLRFLVMRCAAGRAVPRNLTCLAGNDPAGRYDPVSHEWALGVPAGSRGLDDGHPVMALARGAVQAIPGPGSTITTMNLVGRSVTVVRYAIPTGRRLSVLYRARVRQGSLGMTRGSLSADASGRYLIINQGLGKGFGWISHGRLHQLRTPGPYGGDTVSSTTW